MNTPMTINKCEVPQYLQNGSFFKILFLNGTEACVSEVYLKPDQSIESEQDLRHLLGSLYFWEVDKMPMEVFEYVENNINAALLLFLSPVLPSIKERIRAAIGGGGIAPDEILALARMLHSAENFAKVSCELLGLPLEPVCWSIVAAVDDTASIEYLHTKGVTVDRNTFVQLAAKYGSTKCLEYAHSQGWKLPNQALLAAVEGGQLESVRFLHKTCDKTLTVSTMLQAAEFGKLEVMRYLHENGCPWDASVCAAAAKAGHLDCLEYAHQQGCPWDESTIISAKENTRANSNLCLDYALEHRCPIPLNEDIIFKGHLWFTCVVSLVLWFRTAYNGIFAMHVLRSTLPGGHVVYFMCSDSLVYESCKVLAFTGELTFAVYRYVYYVLFWCTPICLCISILFFYGYWCFKVGLDWLPEAMLASSVSILLLHQYFWVAAP